jgi:hypothetical protein
MVFFVCGKLVMWKWWTLIYFKWVRLSNQSFVKWQWKKWTWCEVATNLSCWWISIELLGLSLKRQSRPIIIHIPQMLICYPTELKEWCSIFFHYYYYKIKHILSRPLPENSKLLYMSKFMISFQARHNLIIMSWKLIVVVDATVQDLAIC